MPLLFVDLDNTLVDRAAAFAAWASEYLEARGADPALLDAMITADGDGLRPKPEVRADITELLGLSEDESATLIDTLRAGAVSHLELATGAREGLIRARRDGWTICIATNGVEKQQQAKIDKLRLAELVDGWVISEAVQATKPDPEHFRLGAVFTEAEDDLVEAWHIGDSAEADIVGAHNAGLRSVWLARGREWPAHLEPPTAIADSFGEAIDVVLASGRQA